MQLEKFSALLLAALEDSKARNVQTLKVKTLCDITDLMIIADGSSDRHVKFISDTLVETGKRHDNPPLGVEGKEHGHWVLLDFGDIIVHVMQPAVRAHYQLEKLWSHAEAAENV